MDRAKAPWALRPLEAREIVSGLHRTEFVHGGARAHVYALSAGRAEIVWEADVREVCAPVIIWLPTGDGAVLRPEAGTRGWMLSAPPSYLDLGDRQTSAEWAGIDLGLDRRTIQQEAPPKLIERVSYLIQTIKSELENKELGGTIVIDSCFKQLFVEILRLPNALSAGDYAVVDALARRFVRLVDAHLTSHWRLSQYSERLGVSKDQLTIAVRRATGRTPAEYLHWRLMAEAKSLLKRSDQPVSELALALGFCDAAYFNRFFRKRAGLSPGKFRREVRAGRASTDVSYYAWP